MTFLMGWRNRAPNVSRNVAPNEPLARYIFSSRQFNSTQVKTAAFIPRDGEVSVFRTLGLNEDEIWDIGNNHVAPLSNRKLKARGDTAVNHAINIKLTVEAETSNHPLHANINNWPDDRADQLALALDLANSATLRKNTDQHNP